MVFGVCTDGFHRYKPVMCVLFRECNAMLFTF